MNTVRKNMARWAGKRKHVSQLKPFEKTGIWKRLEAVHEIEWSLGDHALDRLRQKGIRATKYDIVSTIYNGKIIEYKIDYNPRTRKYDERVVLRANAMVQGEYNLNAVYSLTNKKIITVWLNHKDDRHSTLDWNIYDKNMEVFI